MTRVKNFEIARLFYEIAALLDARQESRFRIRAYQRAAQTLETLGEDGLPRDAAAREQFEATLGELVDLARPVPVAA